MKKPAGNQNGGSAAPGVEERVSGYVDRLTEFLRQCANDVEDRPDAFLWGARRSLEAMLSAIYTKDGTFKPTTDMSSGQLLDQFEKKEGLINRDVLGALRSLQSEGNYGTHLQSHEPMACDEPVERCRQSLVNAVNWFFARSNVSPREMPPEIKTALDVLAKKVPPPARVERARALRERRETVEERDALRAKLAVVQREWDETREREIALQRKVDQFERAPTRRTVVSSADSGPPRWRTPAAVGVGLALLVAAVGAWATGRPAGSSSGPVAADGPQSEPGPDAGQVPGPVVRSAEDAGTPDAAIALLDVRDAGPARGCAEGMVQFNGGVTKFGEPYPRPSWRLKSPKETGLQSNVAPFCIDRTEVSAKVFPAGEIVPEQERARVKGSGCHRAGGVAAPMNCVTHAKAAAYCEGRGARLPRLVEWEHVASAGSERRLDIAADGREWVEDAFPSPAWERAPPPEPCDGSPCYLAREARLPDAPTGAARYSWMRYSKEKWFGDLTFRCAQDLK